MGGVPSRILFQAIMKKNGYGGVQRYPLASGITFMQSEAQSSRATALQGTMDVHTAKAFQAAHMKASRYYGYGFRGKCGLNLSRKSGVNLEIGRIPNIPNPRRTVGGTEAWMSAPM
jgi:hypothetical protein